MLFDWRKKLPTQPTHALSLPFRCSDTNGTLSLPCGILTKVWTRSMLLEPPPPTTTTTTYCICCFLVVQSMFFALFDPLPNHFTLQTTWPFVQKIIFRFRSIFQLFAPPGNCFFILVHLKTFCIYDLQLINGYPLPYPSFLLPVPYPKYF